MPFLSSHDGRNRCRANGDCGLKTVRLPTRKQLGELFLPDLIDLVLRLRGRGHATRLRPHGLQRRSLADESMKARSRSCSLVSSGTRLFPPAFFDAVLALALALSSRVIMEDDDGVENSDSIIVKTTADRGRGVFAMRALEHGATLVRAIPAACVPSDAYLRTCCCVCLQRTVSLPCAKCGAAVLCARCASSKGARLIHEDECASLRMLFAHEDRPADTRSLRLLMRLILWKWRCSQPDAPQYIGESDDDKGAAKDGDGGDGGDGGGGGGGEGGSGEAEFQRERASTKGVGASAVREGRGAPTRLWGAPLRPTRRPWLPSATLRPRSSTIEKRLRDIEKRSTAGARPRNWARHRRT